MLALLLVGPLPAAHAALTLKAGDVVIVMRQSPLKIDNDQVHFVRRGTVLAVESVRDPWLWVTQGKSGWILGNDVIPRERAVGFFSQEILSQPANPEGLRCRGKAYLALGNARKALADFNRALMFGPSPLLFADRGLAWSLAGQYDKAIGDFSEAIRTHQTQRLTSDELAAIHCLRGLARAGKGEAPQAIADLDEAIRLSPELAFAFNQRGKAWLADGNSTMKAIADFNEALRLNPVFDSAYNNRGLAWAAMGDIEKSLADFRAAISLDPDAAFARNTRSRMLAEAVRDGQEQTPDSTAMLDALDSPTNNLALLLAACPEEKYRDGKQSLQLAQRLCQLDGYRFAPFLSTLAAAYAETGDFANAVQWQSRAIELGAGQSKDEFRSRLAAYQSGKPYRHKPKS